MRTYFSTRVLFVALLSSLFVALANCYPSYTETTSADDASAPGVDSIAASDAGLPAAAVKPAVIEKLSAYCQDACDKTLDPDVDDATWSICYTCKCKQLLGALPTPTQANCDLGQDIHVYTAWLDGGVPVEVDEPNDLTNCDNPIELTSADVSVACIPGSKLGQGTLPANPAAPLGVLYKFICRRKPGVPRDAGPIYIDHGVIAHNPVNGATCFWVDHSDGFSPGILPNLDLTDGDPAKISAYTAFWDAHSEGDHCVECHDNDPFMFSEHLKSVYDFNTTVHRFSPYAQVRAVGAPTTVPHKRLVSPEAAACTSCHRISDGYTCSRWLALSTGTPTSDRPYQQDILDHPDSYFPITTWMPHPFSTTLKTKADWEATYGAAVSFIADCCANPMHDACKWQDAVGFQGDIPAP